ncbi:MAG TPA: glycosyltransferase [Polyangiaceae bacterium]|nr:glycosyltransferase [Polyangiaceae bacterium]
MRNEALVESNTGALRRAYPCYADVLSLVSDANSYRFEPAGAATACRDERGHWLHGPEDPWEAAHRDARALVVDAPHLYIVIRPGLGYQALALLELVESRGLESVVLVVEDRLELWKASLAFTNWGPVFHCPSAVLLLGKLDAVIDAYFARNPRLSLLPVTVVTGPDCMDDFDCERLVERLEARSIRIRSEIEQTFIGADFFLHRRRTLGEPLRVVLAGEHGYLTGPYSEGFRACGCDVEVLPGDSLAPRNVRAQDWASKLLTLVPDLVLWANRPELSAFGSAGLRALGVANVVWSVDSPRRARLTKRELDTIDLHLYFDTHDLSTYAGLGARRSEQLSLAAGIEPLPDCAPDRLQWPSRRGPAVSFVGSSGYARVINLREFIRRVRPEDLEFLDELAATSADVTETFEKETGKPYAGAPVLYVDEIRTIRRRTGILRALPVESLKIFGGPDWAHADASLADCLAGSVRYGTDLASIYFHSLININVFHAQCIDSTNSRVYDVLASGGFLLTEDSPAIRREFEPDRHLVTFATPAEAADKVAFYLARPEAREAIAREGQKHVLAQHTFLQRCARLLALARPFMGTSPSEKSEGSTRFLGSAEPASVL